VLDLVNRSAGNEAEIRELFGASIATLQASGQNIMNRPGRMFRAAQWRFARKESEARPGGRFAEGDREEWRAMS
jgi:hypothetical protein